MDTFLVLGLGAPPQQPFHGAVRVLNSGYLGGWGGAGRGLFFSWFGVQGQALDALDNPTSRALNRKPLTP